MTVRRALTWLGWALTTIAAAGALAWAAHRFNRTEPISIRGAATLVALAVAPLYGYCMWSAHNRGWLIERADDTMDAVEQAHERIDAIGERQQTTHRLAAHAAGIHQTPAQPTTAPIRRARTVERPALDLAGGARFNGATASGRGRHAAPETGTFDRAAGDQ